MVPPTTSGDEDGLAVGCGSDDGPWPWWLLPPPLPEPDAAPGPLPPPDRNARVAGTVPTWPVAAPFSNAESAASTADDVVCRRCAMTPQDAPC